MRYCLNCGRELPKRPWYQRGLLSGFGPIPRCQTDLARCRQLLEKRLGL